MKITPILFIILSYICGYNSLDVKVTNAICEIFDKNFCEAKECELKVVGRNKIAVNIFMKILQLPIESLKLNAQLLRKSFDYRPFLYNDTVEFCEFVQNQNKYLFWKIIFDEVKAYTNLNHSCPLNHDLVFKNFVLNKDHFKLIPFPAGDYQLKYDSYVADDLKFRVKFNVALKDYITV